MRYLLDTTVLIDHVKDRHGAVALLAGLFAEPNDLLTCDVVVAEALSSGGDDEVAVLGTLIRALDYVATHPEAARWAGASRRGRGPRSLGDALIAGIAWQNDAVIVTRNPRDFESQGVRVLGYGRRPGRAYSAP